jgi:hypothetical protein
MFLLPGALVAQEPSKPDRVFRSDDVLEVTITGPLRTLMRERSDETDLPGTISYVDDTGATVQVDVGLRTRGNYRRQMRVCPFAPIRLNFDKSDTKGTLFRKQDKMKLVTHCRNSSNRYEQLVLKEYLVYRIMNALSDYSFRVRLLRITYVDSDTPGRQQVSYGFLIEHRDRLAKRLDLRHIGVKSTTVTALLGEYTNLVSMFQYFVANTDFSHVAGEPNDDCCHNSELFARRGEAYYAVPYDFDMAGMTDAPYATPNPKLRIRTVRQRLYRGHCVNNTQLPESLQVFQDNKDAFFILVQNQPDLSGSSKASMFSLMQSFYKLIENPKAVEKKLVRKCG